MENKKDIKPGADKVFRQRDPSIPPGHVDTNPNDSISENA